MATILIVDDCPGNRQHFATPLERRGHRLLEASDTANAMALARKERPHLIIANARVPMKDGFKIVHGLKSDRNLAKTRIILYSDSDFRSDAIALTHAIDIPLFLPKPKDPEEIVSMVDLVLKGTDESVGSGDVVSRRKDRGHPGPSTDVENPGAAELQRLTAENERLAAELRTGEQELKRETERREQAEQKLLKFQEWYDLGFGAANYNRLQAIFENTLDAILLADGDQRFVEANPAACQMLGYTRQELLQMNLPDITSPEDRELANDLWRQFLATGGLRGEYTILCKDGTSLEVEYRAVANALPGLHLSLLQDITERKSVEKQLRESEERFRQLAEHIGEVFWLVDPTQAVPVYVSPAYERIWGRSREDLRRSPYSWTEAIHPADRGRVKESADKMFDPGFPR